MRKTGCAVPDGRGTRQAGVLDVGCHSALLTVVRRRRADGTDGVVEPVFSRKVRLSLHQALGPHGRLRESGMKSVERAVAEAVAADPRWRRSEVFAFATSVIRDAPNRVEVTDRVARTTGIRLRVLPGEEEARLAYVAARQWMGPSTRPLLVLDIGGGTVEIAAGSADLPRTVHSLPLGARRITREWLPGGVITSPWRLVEVRKHLRKTLAAVPALPRAEPGGSVLASSKTFTQLARLARATRNTPLGKPSGRSPGTPLRLTLPELRATIPLLADMTPPHRAKLPGISPHRAEQTLAGALIAEALMAACGTDTVTICPWSTREGLLLEHLGVTSTPRFPLAAA